MGIYNDLSNCETLPQLRSKITECLKVVGFDRYILIYNKGDTFNALTNVGNGFLESYRVRGFRNDDALDVKYNSEMKLVRQSDYRDMFKHNPFNERWYSRNQRIINLFDEHGFKEAITFYEKLYSENMLRVTVGSSNPSSTFYNAVDHNMFFLRMVFEIVARLLSVTFRKEFLCDYSRTKIIDSSLIREGPLTLKQAVLVNAMVSNDLSLKDAAEKIHVTIDTANKHIKAAKENMGVSTVAALVYKATVLGIIK